MQHIGDLISDPQNARRHTPRNVSTIEAALREVGAARSIVVDEDLVVLAGAEHLRDHILLPARQEIA